MIEAVKSMHGTAHAAYLILIPHTYLILMRTSSSPHCPQSNNSLALLALRTSARTSTPESLSARYVSTPVRPVAPLTTTGPTDGVRRPMMPSAASWVDRMAAEDTMSGCLIDSAAALRNEQEYNNTRIKGYLMDMVIQF